MTGSSPTALDEYLLLLQVGPAVLKSVAVLAIDLNESEMNIIWSSRLLDELFGYDRGELRGRSLNILLKPEDREPHLGFFATYQKFPNTRTMNDGVWVDGLKKDGTLIKVQVSLCPQEVGKRDVVVAHVVDVTRAFDHSRPGDRPPGDAH